MKNFFSCLIAASLILAAVSGCVGQTDRNDSISQTSLDISQNITSEVQADLTEESPAQTEEVLLPPADTDCYEVADEYALALQSLFLDYMQFEEEKLAVKVDKEYSKGVFLVGEGGFYPIIDDKIKCYDDLKSVFLEYCTDEYADELLKAAQYRDIDGKLYIIDTDLSPAASYACFVDDCRIEGNKMTVDILEIGRDSELFPKDLDEDDYPRMSSADTHHTMTLEWRNEKWLISGCNYYSVADIGYSYRSVSELFPETPAAWDCCRTFHNGRGFSDHRE